MVKQQSLKKLKIFTMQAKKLIFSILNLIFIIACTPSSDKNISTLNEVCFRIDVRKSIYENNHDNQMLLSELSDEITYIPLETNESCLLSRISDFIVSRNYLFINDSRIIYQFDKSGNFIRQVGSSGKGPGEHGRNIKFSIDDFNEEIIVLSHPTIMNIFDIKSGKFKRSFPVKLDISNFSVYPEGKIIFLTRDVHARFLESTINEIYISDNNGNLIDSVANYTRLKNRSNSVAFSSSYIENDDLFYIYNYHDTLFHLTKYFEKKAYAVFKLTKEIKREELLIEPIQNKVQYPDFLWIQRILENQKYFFISLQKGFSIGTEPNIYKIVFDKKSGKIETISGITDNINTGLDFWPKWKMNDILIDYYYPYQIIDYYESTKGKNKHSRELLNIINNIKEGDNPVMVFVKGK